MLQRNAPGPVCIDIVVVQQPQYVLQLLQLPQQVHRQFRKVDGLCHVAEAFYLLSLYGKPFSEYVIGSGDAKPLKLFIKELIDAVSPNYPANFGNIPFTGVNLPLDVFSPEKLIKDCGFSPKISFKDGVKRTFNYIKG